MTVGMAHPGEAQVDQAAAATANIDARTDAQDARVDQAAEQVSEAQAALSLPARTTSATRTRWSKAPGPGSARGRPRPICRKASHPRCRRCRLDLMDVRPGIAELEFFLKKAEALVRQHGFTALTTGHFAFE